VADVPAARKVIYRGTFTEGRHATECAYLSESTIAQLFCFSEPCSRIVQEGAAIDEHVSFGRKCNTNNNEKKEEKTYE
jgi:hypothetical protein